MMLKLMKTRIINGNVQGGLLLDPLSKIWEPFFDQVAEDVKNVFTFSRWPLVAELKLKIAEFAAF